MDKTPDEFILRLTKKAFDKNKLKPPAQLDTTQKQVQLQEWFVDLVEMGRPRLTLYVFIHPVIFSLVIVHAKNIAQAIELFGKRLSALLDRLEIKPEVYADKIPSSNKAVLLPTNNGSILGRWTALRYMLVLYITDYRDGLAAQNIPVDPEELCKVMEDRMAVYPIFYTRQNMLDPGKEMVKYLTTKPEPIKLAQAMLYEITLKDVEPPISRVFQISRQSTFYDLHHIIQVIMGWENRHLFEFRAAGNVIYLPELNEFDSDWEELYDTQPLNSRTILLTELISEPGESFTYLYDFGDDWEHELTFKCYTEVPENQIPLCSSGTGGNVPEDSGGAPGFSEMLNVLSDPKHDLYKEYKSWLGRRDPFTFSLIKTNQSLKNLKRYTKEYERYLPKTV